MCEAYLPSAPILTLCRKHALMQINWPKRSHPIGYMQEDDAPQYTYPACCIWSASGLSAMPERRMSQQSAVQQLAGKALLLMWCNAKTQSQAYLGSDMQQDLPPPSISQVDCTFVTLTISPRFTSTYWYHNKIFACPSTAQPVQLESTMTQPWPSTLGKVSKPNTQAIWRHTAQSFGEGSRWK